MRINHTFGVSKRRALTLAISFLSVLTAIADDIHGIVTDAQTGEPIIGAAISLKNDKGGKTLAVTDIDGKFNVNIKSFPATIVVGFTGYNNEEYDVYESTNDDLQVELSENFNSLNEVVVVGYGTQTRKELTGSIATIDKAALKQPATSFDGLLGGSVAGLNVSEASGQPGAQSSIRIRGGNSINAGNDPLYVVDGVIIYNDNTAASFGVGRSSGDFNVLSSINPNDIESIEVLKDVSATAIYGTRGANGVIIITTKKGHTGQTHIEYQYNIGWQKAAKTLDFMTARQWGELYNEIASPTQVAETGLTPEVVATLGKGYDWQDAALRTATTQQHQLSISGGSDKTHFLISGNYSDQDGIIIGTNFRRFSTRLNLDHEISKQVKVGVNASFSKVTQNGLSNYGSYDDNSTVSGAYNGLYVNDVQNPFDYVLRIPAVVPIYNQDGSYNYSNLFENGDLRLGNTSVNAISDLVNVTNETKTNNVIGNAYVTYNPIPELTAKFSAGTSLINSTLNYFAPSYTTPGFSAGGYGSVGNRRYDSYQYEGTLEYAKQLTKAHYLDVLVGYTTQTTKTEYATAANSKFANENLSYHNLQGGSGLLTPQSGAIESTLHSFLGRVNYTLLGRYNLTATLRADGSSRFAKDHKWGWFPSLGLSWNVSDEKFLKNNPVISDLKIRASVGTVGNQEIGDYKYAATYRQFVYSFGGNLVTAYGRGNAGDDDLKWEKTTQYDLGFDLNLFKGRLGFVFDTYYKKTSDLLLQTPVEISTGFSSQLRNVGSLTNRGVEFSVNANVFRNKDWNWNVSANIAHNKNKVTDLGNLSYILGNYTITKVGEPLGSFYGFKAAGVVQKGEDLSKVPSPSFKPTVEYGDLKYVDQNGDGEIDLDNDRVVLGSIQPDFTYGFSTTLTWKDLSLFASFQGSHGNKVYNGERQRLEQPSTNYNVLASVANRWTETNPSTTIPRAYVLNTTYIDSRYVEDASYLRLKNITLTYKLPFRLRALPTAQIKLLATATNLFTITGYKGYDPEVANGIDIGTYPTARTFSFGVNITY